MKNRLIIFSCFLLFFSCSSKNTVPYNILKPEEMYPILWDLAKADEYTTSYFVEDSLINKGKERLILYNQILKIHDTDEKEFKKSLKFYENNPVLMKLVLDSLGVRDKYEEIIKASKLKDSIKSKPLNPL